MYIVGKSNYVKKNHKNPINKFMSVVKCYFPKRGSKNQGVQLFNVIRTSVTKCSLVGIIFTFESLHAIISAYLAYWFYYYGFDVNPLERKTRQKCNVELKRFFAHYYVSKLDN